MGNSIEIENGRAGGCAAVFSCGGHLLAPRTERLSPSPSPAAVSAVATVVSGHRWGAESRCAFWDAVCAVYAVSLSVRRAVLLPLMATDVAVRWEREACGEGSRGAGFLLGIAAAHDPTLA